MVWSFNQDTHLRCGSLLWSAIGFGTLCLSTASVKWTALQGIREGCIVDCEELSFPWLPQLALAWSLAMATFCLLPLLLDNYLLTSGFPF